VFVTALGREDYMRTDLVLSRVSKVTARKAAADEPAQPIRLLGLWEE
jgi:hypothetical protein